MQSVLPLRRGTNVVVAVSGRTDASLTTKLDILAAHVGALVGGEPEYAGTLLSGVTVWVIGYGRPVFLRRLSANPRLDRWYARMGEPVGPDREYWSIVIDWRGPDLDATVPAGMFVIPAVTRVVHGRESWPDGTLEEQQARVAQTTSNERLAKAASSLRATNRHIAAAMPSAWPVAIAAMGTLGLSLLLQRR